MSVGVRDEAGTALQRSVNGQAEVPNMTGATGVGAPEWRLVLPEGYKQGEAIIRMMDRGGELCLRGMTLPVDRSEGLSSPDPLFTSGITPTVVTINSAVTASEWGTGICVEGSAEDRAGSCADILTRLMPVLETHEPAIEYEPVAAAFIDSSGLSDERSRAEKILQRVFDAADSISVSLEYDPEEEEDLAPSLVASIKTDLGIDAFYDACKQACRELRRAGCRGLYEHLAIVRA